MEESYSVANASLGTRSKCARLRVSNAADRATQIPAIMQSAMPIERPCDVSPRRTPAAARHAISSNGRIVNAASNRSTAADSASVRAPLNSSNTVTVVVQRTPACKPSVTCRTAGCRPRSASINTSESTTTSATWHATLELMPPERPLLRRRGCPGCSRPPARDRRGVIRQLHSAQRPPSPTRKTPSRRGALLARGASREAHQEALS